MGATQRFPRNLANGPFTLADARAAGASDGSLRHRDVIRLSRGIKSLPNDAELPLALLTRPFTLVTGYSAASHATAFAIWDLPGFLPGARDQAIHIARQFPHAAPRRKGVVAHRTQFTDDEVEFHQGLWITTRARTWLDCARLMSVDELIVVADHLIRIPRPQFEGRELAYSTVDDLARMLDRHKGTPGIPKARDALALARVGADSAPETRLRLAVVRAGLPEPELNMPVRLGYGVERTPDQSFPEYRVAVEYDGGTHASPDQVVRDVAREEDFARFGWAQVRITKRHMENDARDAVAKIRSALLANGWRPSPRHL
ncbi:hypothetical protein AL755_21595 [Arthrobacter sp. ERGS1:01]|uniref:hypothetical protein n=1 Tax=Arthrobacter sp. ERGS1:01 TaxID=1704044 RepID=UPI0006B460B5|nr:hypothetical protein [Arthrobacter sp. ERGS1:01]ALE07470.1 hypothetical protein AL755_21595 [Arthrobacter sp. ERGS1:01]